MWCSKEDLGPKGLIDDMARLLHLEMGIDVRNFGGDKSLESTLVLVV